VKEKEKVKRINLIPIISKIKFSFLDSNLDESGALAIIQAILQNGRNSFKEIK